MELSEEEKKAIKIMKDFVPKIYWLHPDKSGLQIDEKLDNAKNILLNLIEKQQKEIESADHLASVEYIEQNFISKQVIRDKIEELTKMCDELDLDSNKDFTISTLKELLGGINE